MYLLVTYYVSGTGVTIMTTEKKTPVCRELAVHGKASVLVSLLFYSCGAEKSDQAKIKVWGGLHSFLES